MATLLEAIQEGIVVIATHISKQLAVRKAVLTLAWRVAGEPHSSPVCQHTHFSQGFMWVKDGN